MLAVLLLAACGGSTGVLTGADGATCTTEQATAAALSPKGGLDVCDNTCRRPGGFICKYGTGYDRCPAGDGFNDRDCYPGSSGWSCTSVASLADAGTSSAPDGGIPANRCTTGSDCAYPGSKCKFDLDPREALGWCAK
ncbi:MAG: hypothetical protein ABI321_17635 [Polyangia bacterium]